MAQRWSDVLFAHWPVSADELRQVVPAALPLDTYEGQAWLGIVPFRMSRVRPRWLPPLPRLSAFPELNVRTYVTLDDRPGVYFFSLDAASAMAVAFGRRFYHLPYFRARMTAVRVDGSIRYTCRRTHAGEPPARFRAAYRPAGPVIGSEPGTLAHFLTERYCLYTAGPGGEVRRADIAHRPWPLQPAQAEIRLNTMAAPIGVTLPHTPPLLHFARQVDMVGWWPQRRSTAE
jgi:uncharacterized protein YqjF (DUF2071 family)